MPIRAKHMQIQLWLHSWFLGVVLLISSLSCPLLKADDVYTFIVKKQEVKTQYRWNLTDWLTTRDKMRLQDLWLALHSPSPYEFFLGGTYQWNQTTPGGAYTAYDFSFGAFSSIVGIEGQYESGVNTRFHGIFDFRFMGYHDQSTNLTLQLGLAQTNIGTDAYRNALVGVKLTLYLTRFFGVQGMIRHYFPSTPSLLGSLYGGDRYQAGGFIDFQFIRIYSDYFTDAGSGPSTTGVLLGTKLYF